MQNGYCRSHCQPIDSQATFVKILEFGKEHYSPHSDALAYWERFRKTVELLACYHGFVGDQFVYRENATASLDMPREVKSKARHVKNSNPDSINSEEPFQAHDHQTH